MGSGERRGVWGQGRGVGSGEVCTVRRGVYDQGRGVWSGASGLEPRKSLRGASFPDVGAPHKALRGVIPAPLGPVLRAILGAFIAKS